MAGSGMHMWNSELFWNHLEKKMATGLSFPAGWEWGAAPRPGTRPRALWFPKGIKSPRVPWMQSSVRASLEWGECAMNAWARGPTDFPCIWEWELVTNDNCWNMGTSSLCSSEEPQFACYLISHCYKKRPKELSLKVKELWVGKRVWRGLKGSRCQREETEHLN